MNSKKIKIVEDTPRDAPKQTEACKEEVAVEKFNPNNPFIASRLLQTLRETKQTELKRQALQPILKDFLSGVAQRGLFDIIPCIADLLELYTTVNVDYAKTVPAINKTIKTLSASVDGSAEGSDMIDDIVETLTQTYFPTETE